MLVKPSGRYTGPFNAFEKANLGMLRKPAGMVESSMLVWKKAYLPRLTSDAGRR